MMPNHNVDPGREVIRIPDQGTESLSLIRAVAKLGARLVSAIEADDGLEILHTELSRVCRFRNFIVYIFREGSRPALLYTNLGMDSVRESMADYIKGLYALDPFYKLNLEKATGLYRMSDIMPGDFPKSEYFRHFYRFTNVVDELRYIVRPAEDQAVHVFVEQESSQTSFSQSEVGLFRALTPLIEAFVSAHIGWRFRQQTIQSTPAPRFDLREKIEEMSSGSLTPREVDTVELMLKGHATKSIAFELSIDSGTVANHKRHIYEKLEIHSQAQLFDRFLSSLV